MPAKYIKKIKVSATVTKEIKDISKLLKIIYRRDVLFQLLNRIIYSGASKKNITFYLDISFSGLFYFLTFAQMVTDRWLKMNK